MESKKAQKLSKAAVATVLATSGILVAMPHPTNAYSFEDLNPLADYYEPVLDLANRKIASGYSDGTFKPNKAITREDAAKMLALTIDVNIANPKNPGFKDVTASNPNYRYIAALAEAGVINGYSDGTFKPKEPITRGQMAKILTLGFKFGISTKLTHGFKDVTAKNANAYFIQTLYDLNVTKGKSPVAFDPFNTVTRGQMATFIWRAEKADRGTPVYAVGDIIGDQIYINGVAHTIAPHLRSILSVGNKNILKGAYIEGDFSGNRINNISKLTINASGTSSRLLAMNGNNTSFAGELVVNGSYLRFKNITFTGRVEVAEAPRRSLANLSQVRVANIGTFANFIDWGESTDDKNEDQLNPDDNETLVDKPDPSKPVTKYKDRMPNLKKYVDFEDSDIRHLYVTADRTFLKANYEIDRLYVERDVSNFELYADPNAMYIDTDYNLNVYGVHDIRYLYKNTLKNVHLKSDATYDYYYITSSNGFTNLGEFAYITNAIIPIGKTVNDVFDDFYTDEPQIGHIEDEDGKEVSRDPVGDTVIKDMTAPKITQLTATAGGTVADITLKADEDGTYYYVVKRADEKPPTINEIKTGGAGSGPIIMDEPVKFQVQGLETMTDYVIYAIVIDGDDNVSEKEEAAFSTIDNKPPLFTLKPGDKMPGGKKLEFIFSKISEPGTIYYYIREKGTSSVTPTVDDIISKHTGTVTAPDTKDIPVTAREYGIKPNLNPIQPSTSYEIFAVMVDKTDNKMRVVEQITITTEAPDLEQPYVANDAKLTFVDKDKGIFEFTVSKELDPETAKNPKNYELSGTGIINIQQHLNQDTVHPTKVEVNGKKVRLTIPAVQALVKGDTIRVTVSKNVTDLAENEFENVDRYPADQNSPRNVAYYTHEDKDIPSLTIDKVIVEKDFNLVEFNASKAGTYYYMILERGFDFTGKDITPRDFVDEFELMGQKTKFGEVGAKDYTGNLLNQYGPAELNLNSKNINIEFGKLERDKSYSVYMVLKDRAGLLADKIIEAPIVEDSQAPIISDLKVNAKVGSNNSVDINFTTDELGTLYVIPVEKYIYDPSRNQYVINEKHFEEKDGEYVLKPIHGVFPEMSSALQREAFNKVATPRGIKIDKVGPITLNVDNLKEHMEYGFYIAAEDTMGANKNFTVFESTANGAFTGSQMLRDAYTDGIKPFITNDKNRNKVSPSGNSVLKNNEALIFNKGTESNPIFEITFNEAIMRDKITNTPSISTSLDLSKIMTIKNGNSIVTGSFAVEDYKYNKNDTTQPSTLIIKLNNSTNSITIGSELTVTMNEDTKGTNVYDYKDHQGFDIEKVGKYIIPAQDRRTIELNGTNVEFKNSYEVYFNVEFGLNVLLGQRFYYAVTSSFANRPTVKQIIDASNGFIEPGSDIIVGKTDTVVNPADISKKLPLITGQGNNQNVFQQGQKIYLFTIDNFGNVIWAKEKNGNNDFIKIP